MQEKFKIGNLVKVCPNASLIAQTDTAVFKQNPYGLDKNKLYVITSVYKYKDSEDLFVTVMGVNNTTEEKIRTLQGKRVIVINPGMPILFKASTFHFATSIDVITKPSDLFREKSLIPADAEPGEVFEQTQDKFHVVVKILGNQEEIKPVTEKEESTDCQIEKYLQKGIYINSCPSVTVDGFLANTEETEDIQWVAGIIVLETGVFMEGGTSNSYKEGLNKAVQLANTYLQHNEK